MREARPKSFDLLLAVVLTVAGGAGVIAALLGHWNPHEMNPGVEGSLTAGVLCPLLGLLHGLAYKDTIKLCLPVMAIQYFTLQMASAPTLAVLSIELLVVGFMGFLVSLRAPAEAALRGPSAARRAPDSGRQGSGAPHLAH